MYSPKRQIRLFRNPGWPSKDDTGTLVYGAWRQPTSTPSTRAYAISVDDTGLNAILANAIGAGARGPFVTRNGGQTWSQNTTGMAFPTGVGTFACAVARSLPSVMYCGNNGGGLGYLYKSTDYGTTWTELTSAGQRNWTGLVCNSSGSIVIGAAASAKLYKSDDGGTSWTALNLVDNLWGPLCMSENGNVIVTATTNGGSIHVSTNGGTSFTVKTGTLAGWGGFSCSSDGRIIFGASSSSTILCARSTDSGATWTTGINPSGRSSNTGYNRTACSVNGNKLVVTEGQPSVGGYIWVSQDRGTTWSQQANNNPNNWEGVAMTLNGKTILAGTAAVSAPWVANGV